MLGVVVPAPLLYCHPPLRNRRFPDFKLLSAAGRYRDAVSCVIITHFHLDHCAALPYFTEVGACSDGAMFASLA